VSTDLQRMFAHYHFHVITKDFPDSNICWKFLQGTDEWEAQYVMSEGEGSPMYLDDEGPVVCHGLDHADSQGLNKTNLRLR